MVAVELMTMPGSSTDVDCTRISPPCWCETPPSKIVPDCRVARSVELGPDAMTPAAAMLPPEVMRILPEVLPLLAALRTLPASNDEAPPLLMVIVPPLPVAATRAAVEITAPPSVEAGP